MAEKDTGYFYDYTTDENDKVVNIAWSYEDSYRAYSMFGDVVTFDTSYHSISHGLLLGVWFGIDNHGKVIVFGCVLFQDETSHSFAWALQSFLRFARGRHPQTILTDIDSGLRDAIATELPNTKHVICIWHILSKLSSWFSLPLGSQYTDFKSEFDEVCLLESVEEFEHLWNHLVARFGLASDKHIGLLCAYQAYWPFCYVRNYFVARAISSEYSRSLETFLSRILSSQACLQVFFEQMNLAASHVHQTTPEDKQYTSIKTCMPVEEHARSVVTAFAFNALQNEMVLSMQYEITDMSNGSYLVRHYKKLDESLVIWIHEDEQVHCSCKEFEHSGILCRHSLRVLLVKNCFELPEKYFLLRWRSESSLVPSGVSNNQGRSDKCAQAFHTLAETLLAESLLSKQRFDYACQELTGLIDEVRNMLLIDKVVDSLASNSVKEA